MRPDTYDVGVVGGSFADYPGEIPPSGLIPTGDARAPYAAPAQELDLELRDTGSDVLIEIEPHTGCRLDDCIFEESLLIDDVRVE